MGRRSELQNELEPIEERLIEIIANSDHMGKSFTDVVKKAERAGISRATVARSLPRLIEKGVVKKENLEGKKARYKLAMEALHTRHAQRSLFSVLSMHLFNEILEGASTGKLADEEFTKLFTKRIGALAMYTLLTGLKKVKEDPEEAGKWIEEAFGTLIQKDGWRTCLNRQIFGKPVPLRRIIILKKPLTPEIVVEEGTIYVKLPAAIEPGLSARVLEELPKIPENRLREIEASLKESYPEETELLDQVSSLIKEAASISSKRR
jgi:predicted transcriptional regulator